jgi:hypothetical protein
VGTAAGAEEATEGNRAAEPKAEAMMAAVNDFVCMCISRLCGGDKSWLLCEEKRLSPRCYDSAILRQPFRAANRTLGCAVNTLVWSALLGHCREKGIEPKYLKRAPNCKGLEAPREREAIIKTVIDCRALARPTRYLDE